MRTLVLCCTLLTSITPAQDAGKDSTKVIEDTALEIDDLEGLGDLEGLDDLEGLGDAETTSVDDGLPRLREWKGFVESRLRSYLESRGSDQDDDSWLLEIEGELAFDLTPSVDAFFRPRFRIDTLDEENRRFEPLEAYATWRGDSWDVRAGQFVENWGIADTYNPVDVLNRRDLAGDFLDPQRLGELGAKMRLLFDGRDTIGEPTLSLYALPVYRTPEFPTDESRWYFGQQSELRFADDREVLPEGFDSTAWAARFQSTLSTSPANADLQLLAFHGPERFPTFEIRPGAGAMLDLVPVYFGVTTLGGGVRAVPNSDGWADYTLKLEAAYKWTHRTADGEPAELPDDYATFALGVDRLIPNLLTTGDQLTMTLEYVGETGADDIASDFRPFDNDFVLRAFWEANDFSRTSLESRALIDLETAETILQLLFERQLRFVHEDLKLIADLQVFLLQKEKPSLFNFFPNNTNLALALRWDF